MNETTDHLLCGRKGLFYVAISRLLLVFSVLLAMVVANKETNYGDYKNIGEAHRLCHSPEDTKANHDKP
jgi:hypothetical protein